jgi:hypothetical protein
VSCESFLRPLIGNKYNYDFKSIYTLTGKLFAVKQERQIFW